MANHLTPEELAKEMGIERQDVIKVCASRKACPSIRARSTRPCSKLSSRRWAPWSRATKRPSSTVAASEQPRPLRRRHQRPATEPAAARSRARTHTSRSSTSSATQRSWRRRPPAWPSGSPWSTPTRSAAPSTACAAGRGSGRRGRRRGGRFLRRAIPWTPRSSPLASCRSSTRARGSGG